VTKRQITVSVDRLRRRRPDEAPPRRLPADERSCPSCQSHYRAEEMRRNLRVCATCGHHFAVGARERIDQLAEGGSWIELWPELRASDPLQFVDLQPYPDRVEKAERGGSAEALMCAELEIRGHRCVAAVMDFSFLGGSMGAVVGEKLARCFEAALAERIPAIVVSASGGARMQEGTLSLMQLAKTTAPLERLDEAGVPFIAVLTDPTTGGVLASFASLGDVIVAEPKALIGFAGARVASGTVGEELPEGFQTAEFLLDHGFVDMVVPRADLRVTLSRLLRLLPAAPAADAGTPEDDRARGPIGALSGFAERLGGAVSETIGIDVDGIPDGNGDGRSTAPAAPAGDERR
jgi:acetyl-CoA carboxylase carboxyl transferase subunit beta